MTKLKAERVAAGITQKRLSELSGVNVRLIQDLEQGRRNINACAVVTVLQLAKALDVDIEDILE